MQEPLDMITAVRRNQTTQCLHGEGNIRHRQIAKSYNDYAGGAIYVPPDGPRQFNMKPHWMPAVGVIHLMHR
jgi:hypothetical protein